MSKYDKILKANGVTLHYRTIKMNNYGSRYLLAKRLHGQP